MRKTPGQLLSQLGGIRDNFEIMRLLAFSSGDPPIPDTTNKLPRRVTAPSGFLLGIAGEKWDEPCYYQGNERRHVATSPDNDFTLTIDEALEQYARAGLPRTPRSIHAIAPRAIWIVAAWKRHSAKNI
jgi:hypothetical protein